MKNYFLLFTTLLSFYFTQAQEFKYPGIVLRNNETINGKFSNKLNSKTTVLNFKIDSSGDIINIFKSNDLLFSYSQNKKQYIAKSLNNEVLIAEVLVKGKASLYKDIKSDNLLIETSEHGIRTLEKNEEITKIDGINYVKHSKTMGTLSVIFGDCSEIRDIVSGKNFTFGSISDYTKKYNQCSYSNSYEFSKNQLKNLEFSKKKGIVSVELGATYTSQSIDFSTPSNVVFNDDLNSISIFSNVNFSPSYFKTLRNKLFFDLGAAAVFNSNTNQNSIELEKKSIQANVGVRYNFLTQKSVSPFARVNLGFTVDQFDITSNPTSILNDFGGFIDETRTSFLISFEAGVTVKKIRLSVFIAPEYTSDVIENENLLSIQNQNFGFKAAYILGKK